MPLITRPTLTTNTLRRVACLLAVIAVAALIGLPTFARQTPPELVKKGDALWQEQSYELALEAYRSALAGDPSLPNRAEIDYKIAVGLERTSKWDEAIAAFDAYVRQYKDTLWEARAQAWRGELKFGDSAHHSCLTLTMAAANISGTYTQTDPPDSPPTTGVNTL